MVAENILNRHAQRQENERHDQHSVPTRAPHRKLDLAKALYNGRVRLSPPLLGKRVAPRARELLKRRKI